MERIVSYFILILVCIGSMLLVLPTINQNISDPNLIAYFNHDEGYLMDLVWYHYSGIKSNSFQYDTDYGLELRYLSDIARLVLSRFITITPGTFVFILRWLHLLLWVAALIAFWYFVGYHFGKLWQPLVAVLLFSTNPSFAYIFSSNLKPDPLLLLFMIISLHYTLKMIDGPPRRYFIMAILCAAGAFIIKFGGTFLLPAIVVAMYLAVRSNGWMKTGFPILRAGWIFPGLCGLFCIAMALSSILIYKRRLTGLTWYQEVGLWQSFAQNKLVIYVVLFGIFLIFLSLIFWLINKRSSSLLKRCMGVINELNSYCLIALALFVFFCLLLGFRWVIHPNHFIDLYAQTGREAFGYAHQAALSRNVVATSLLGNFIAKVRDLGPAIFVLFIMYLVIELIMRRRTLVLDRRSLFKRITLLVSMLPYLLYMSSGGRALQHIMLPFFLAAVILGLEGAAMLVSLLDHRKWARTLTQLFIALFLAITVIHNAKTNVDLFIYKYYQHEDVVFDIVKWWRKTYSPDTSIIADHPTHVYLPPEYKNARFLKYQYDRIKQLQDLVSSFKPRLIYLYMGKHDGMDMPPLEMILPNTKIRLIATFDNQGKFYKRRPAAKYVIYEVSY